uniref:Midgut-specific serine protease 2 n=1 Tax=Stomoxys calcitrans TaxID=35570 RepID=O76520_STOCA|nr:midgut-specific serine protease 2 [Stomoxys calcitrans]
MLRFVILFALVSTSLAGVSRNDFYGRIVNGVATTIEEHPYQVSLQGLSGSHFCGGSIISEDIVVTAAHCMQSHSASEFKVRLGSTQYNTGGELVEVKAFKFHENYNSGTMKNDVAVIKLARPVKESATIRFVKLADKTPATGTPAVVTGWGTTCFMACNTLPKTLQKVVVDIVDEKTCASSEYKYGSKIKPTMVCAYAEDKDACQGDSGGPLVAGGKLVGVVSWGKGCALPAIPGVYADVPSLRTWIEKTAKEL